jgi:hypothetical protein
MAVLYHEHKHLPLVQTNRALNLFYHFQGLHDIVQSNNLADKVLALIHCELESILGEIEAVMTGLVYEWRWPRRRPNYRAACSNNTQPCN